MQQWEIDVFEFAHEAHYDQYSNDGRDYFHSHIIPVVNNIKCAVADNGDFSETDYRNMVTAGYLHDVLEDCLGKYLKSHNRNITISLIRSEFGSEVLDLVLEVTHTKKNTFPNLTTRKGYIIKYSDRLANLSRPIGKSTPEFIKNYMKGSIFWKTE